MYRPAISYAMISLVLLAQVGVPMHLHYCKGMLESVSIYFSGKCDDHLEAVTTRACCKTDNQATCGKEDSGCCHDRVTMLVREFSSVSPSFPKWVDMHVVPSVVVQQPDTRQEKLSHGIIEPNVTDTGPPLYILHLSLIYYA